MTVSVFAQVRPAIDRIGAVPWTQASEATHAVHVLDHGADLKMQEFVFDGVFAPETSQQHVFTKVCEPILREALNGVNGAIFMYGQAATGKTHSLTHMLPELAVELFRSIEADPASRYEVEVSAIQVYKDLTDDLLHSDHNAGSGHNLSVQSSGVVLDLTWLQCQAAEQLTQAFSHARTRLMHAETEMGKASSCSHMVFQIKLMKQGQESTTCAKLFMVDLAGSQNAKSNQFPEIAAINRDLLALGNLVSTLGKKERNIPFPDSNLTQILRPCLGEACKIGLLVCVSPSKEHTQETLCSLKFASQAMTTNVLTEVTQHVDDHGDNLSQQAMVACISEGRPTSEAKPDDAQLRLNEALAHADKAELRAVLAEQATIVAVTQAREAEAQIAAVKHAMVESQSRAAKFEVAAAAAQAAADRWQMQYEEAVQQIKSLKTNPKDSCGSIWELAEKERHEHPVQLAGRTKSLFKHIAIDNLPPLDARPSMKHLDPKPFMKSFVGSPESSLRTHSATRLHAKQVGQSPCKTPFRSDLPEVLSYPSPSRSKSRTNRSNLEKAAWAGA